MGRTLIVEELTRPTIENQKEVVAEVGESADCWMTPIKKFLEDGTFPANPTEAKRIKRQASRYVIQNGQLYDDHTCNHYSGTLDLSSPSMLSRNSMRVLVAAKSAPEY